MNLGHRLYLSYLLVMTPKATDRELATPLITVCLAELDN